jgi:CDP-archaeol synthase
MHIQSLVIVQFLVLLTVANGTPVIAKKCLRKRFSYPMDGGARFVDGQPLFGPSKTIRGILLSVSFTSACSALLGLGWRIGVLVGSAAMAGDLFSSFLKRRIKLTAGGRATGLDQVPESLFPFLVCRNALSLTAVDITVGVTTFFIGEVLLSRLLYKFHIRDRPY